MSEIPETLSPKEGRSALDPEILQAARNLREEVSIEASSIRLYEGLEGRLRGFLGKRGFAGEAGDDLVQEVFAEVFAKISSLRGEENFRQWFFSIAANTVRDAHRKRSSQSQRTTGLADRYHHQRSQGDLWIHGGRFQCCADVPLVVAQEDRALYEEVKVVIRSANLSKRMRWCLIFQAQGKTDAQIAEALGITPSTVRDHASRAKKKLREAFASASADYTFIS